MVESGQFINKHGVAILLNKRWKNQIKWVHCESERIVAMSISVDKHPIVLMSVYKPHSGYADHHVEKVYKTINKMLEGEKGMKIVGGDFNAELGPGEGLELSAVGHYTLNKGNCRGEWMTQWLLQNKLMAMNTMYKKVPQKQATFYTSKNVGKQLDYILSDKKHYKWSRDAEACDTIHKGSDHRCVKARFEIPNDKEKGKPRKNKAPPTEQNSDDEKQQKYLDLEQRVKAVDSRQITKESTSEVKDVNTAAVSREAKADDTEGSRAADASEASAAGEIILGKRQAAAPEGTAATGEQKKRRREQRESERRDKVPRKEKEGKEGKTATDASAAPAATAAEEGSMKRHAAASEGTAPPEVPERNEKDERIRALIHERKTCGKHNKDRIREISKEIKKYIRENKRLRRQEKIQKILEKVQGTKNINSIKSAKRNEFFSQK